MPRFFRTKVWIVVLLSSACNTFEAKGKPVPRSEAAAGARAADSGKGAGRRPELPVCIHGEMSVPHSPEDPCPQDDPVCRSVGGTAFTTCEEGHWSNLCVCFVPEQKSPTTICGNEVIEKPTEQCDQTNLNQATCVSLGFQGGALRCNATTCLYDTQLCR